MYLLQAEARQLKIILDQINPDFRCDSLTLYDGDSQKAALIGPYCGESILPSPFVSTNNKALIHFQSDLDTTFASYRDFYGFKLQYHSYSKSGFDNRISAVQLVLAIMLAANGCIFYIYHIRFIATSMNDKCKKYTR